MGRLPQRPLLRPRARPDRAQAGLTDRLPVSLRGSHSGPFRPAVHRFLDAPEVSGSVAQYLKVCRRPTTPIRLNRLHQQRVSTVRTAGLYVPLVSV